MKARVRKSQMQEGPGQCNLIPPHSDTSAYSIIRPIRAPSLGNRGIVRASPPNFTPSGGVFVHEMERRQRLRQVMRSSTSPSPPQNFLDCIFSSLLTVLYYGYYISRGEILRHQVSFMYTTFVSSL
ncbi:hypothetical protein ACJBU6_01159 [Exserohilum turcicum]